jgi:hypothetical protein
MKARSNALSLLKTAALLVSAALCFGQAGSSGGCDSGKQPPTPPTTGRRPDPCFDPRTVRIDECASNCTDIRSCINCCFSARPEEVAKHWDQNSRQQCAAACRQVFAFAGPFELQYVPASPPPEP